MQNQAQQTNSVIECLRSEVLKLENLEGDLLARIMQVQTSLTCKRARLGEEMNRLIPVDCLPDEILLICFERAIQLWKSSSGDGEDDAPASVVVSHVSRRWRRLAISTPSLWTHVQVTPNKEDDVHLFKRFLHRSANVPIHVHFRHCVDTDEPSQHSSESSSCSEDRQADNYHYIINALLPSIDRITALSALDSGTVVSLLLTRSLTYPASSMPFSETFASLTALTVANPHQRDDENPIAYSLFQRFLSASPNLTSLTLDGKVVKPTGNSITAVDLPSLEYMSITTSASAFRESLSFITSLSASALHHLELRRLVLFWTPDVIGAFFKDTSPKFPNVRHLTLDAIFCKGADRAQLFVEAFPRVVHLTIDALSLEQINPGNLHLVGSDSSAAAVWPLLQELTLDYRFLTPRRLSGVCCWLEARRNEAKQPLHIHILGPVGARRCKGFPRHIKKLQEYGDVDLENINLQAFPSWDTEEDIWEGSSYEVLT
ncbi:hypothetical protein BV22DRAFT_1195538 [Leucogyrophana mollusca]|uniref:Uncharacterized protein n=1 Tax=Leucogyrophana mollusca TaxID=85980 RepID=A0ACB8BK84_9AGAM|nr:hypothetical protein BV22DRAFT_1195538 [Leucogyrophana mollusca]